MTRRSTFLFASAVMLMVIMSNSVFANDEFLKKSISSIDSAVVQAQLEFLASDWMEGRETGTKGCYMAADYIASTFKLYGLEPAGDTKVISPSWRERSNGAKSRTVETYFQNFSLVHYELEENQFLSLINNSGDHPATKSFNFKTDFNFSRANISQKIEGDIVFVGYGFSDDENGYDDFEGVDVEGKIILRLAGYPGHNDTSSKGYKLFKPKGRYGWYSQRREKNKLASEKGAAAILEYDPEEDVTLDWNSNSPYQYNRDYYEGPKALRAGRTGRVSLPSDLSQSSTVSIQISRRILEEIFKSEKIEVSEFEKNAANKLKTASSELEDKNIRISVNVKSEILKVRNVVGKIEGENPNQIVAVGGHYDHVGKKDGYIWNGSDDNASGTVGVMTLAKTFAESGVKPEKTIIFAAWTGEEEGLLGSEYFTANYDEINDVILYLNFDMISRNNDEDTLGNKCSMTFSSRYPQLEINSERFNDEFGLNLDIEYEGSLKPRGGSDHTPFAAIDIPVFYYFGGFHPDYHGISDHSDKANLSKMVNIIKIGFASLWDIAFSSDPFEPAPDEPEEK